MPSLAHLVDSHSSEIKSPRLGEEFEKAKHKQHAYLPDVLTAFKKAAGADRQQASSEESGRNEPDNKTSDRDVSPGPDPTRDRER
ncbi:MAG: hypothetical protein Q7T10_18735 [Rhodoferax sp.]|uniref:hypothetical protein n=1 Tax=Rhodoferax sp. TaxID=50421 RepID=UPI002718F288|nr:hypothetical protein [Rhodoferax sp.]MDO8450833.1 hypothetical protein [Rhodoferax sp.]